MRKINFEIATKIRNEYNVDKFKPTYRELANKYNLKSASTIKEIINNEIYYDKNYITPIKHKNELTNTKIIQIKNSLQENSIEEISKQFNLDQKIIQLIDSENDFFNKKYNGYVYEIYNIETGKKYIGSSILETRFKAHEYDLNRGIHHCKQLQLDWKKYEFSFRKIHEFEQISKSELLKIEQLEIDKYNFNDLYNSAKNVYQPPNFKKIHDNQIDSIRNLYETGLYSFTKLSERFNLSKTHVADIINNKARIDEQYNVPNVKKISKINHLKNATGSGKTKLEHAKQIREKYLTGLHTMEELGEEFRYSRPTIRNIILNKTAIDPNYTPPSPERKKEIHDKLKSIGNTGTFTKLSQEIWDEILNEIFEKKISQRIVAQKYNINQSAISRYIKKNNKMSKRLTTQEFIHLAKEVHNDKYDYSKSVYITAIEDIEVICPEHGSFFIKPNKHTSSKRGCPNCSKQSKKDKAKSNFTKINKNFSFEDFLEKAREVHGNEYDYSLVNYVNSRTKIKIVCLEHGEFEMLSNHHLQGQKCQKCSVSKRKLDSKEFIQKLKEVHKNKYDYSLSEYNGFHDNIIIICKTHGKFSQKASFHLHGSGCPKCSLEKNKKKLTFTTASFIKKAKKVHKDLYVYSLVKYEKSHEKVEIICKTHGKFEQRPYCHLQGQGCPECVRVVSKEELEVLNFIQAIIPHDKIISNDRQVLRNHELDILIPEYNLAIEYNGLYWHSEEIVGKHYHINKTQECEKNNIQLFHIFSDDWNNKKEIIQSMLKNKLGLITDKIYARKCEIKEISKEEGKKFFETNHLSGNTQAIKYFGLYYKDELVSCLSLRKPFHKKYENYIEIARFASKLNIIVIGGFQKLLKYIRKDYDKILTYADLSTGTGDVYEKAGFQFIGNTPLNYWYTNGKKREHRFKYRAQDGKSEKEIAEENNVKKIYGCGSKIYILT